MQHSEVLRMEYGEQYNQYRWIGQMQAVVLTLYGAITTFALASVAALRGLLPQEIDLSWPALVMAVLGFLGLLVGYSLFRSRIMQRRTAQYLVSLLRQLEQETRGGSTGTSGEPKPSTSALRFRGLCTTANRFSLWDTMNITILVAVFAGFSLLVTGLLVLLVRWGAMGIGIAGGLGGGLILFLCGATPLFIERVLMAKEATKLASDYEIVNGESMQEMCARFGLGK